MARDRHPFFFFFLHPSAPRTIPTLSPFGQLPGEKHVGQLALGVGSNRVVVLLAAQVIKVDLAQGVCGRRQVDYPGRRRVFQQVQHQIGEEKVTWGGREGGREVERREGGFGKDEFCVSTQVIDSKLRLVSVLCDAVGTHGHACVVDQEVKTLLSWRKVGGVWAGSKTQAVSPTTDLGRHVLS